MTRTVQAITFIILGFAVALCMAAPQVACADPREDRLREDVTWLADDAREGRGIGTAGLDAAAQYIAGVFQDAGLQPLFDGSYRQEFTMGWGAMALPGSFLALNSDTLALHTDLLPAGFSAAASATAPVVFAGYGISAPEFEYDDYTDVDPSGRLVIAFDGEPRRDDPDALFAGELDTDHASPRTKAINAKIHGAAGLLLVPAPGEPDELPTLHAEEPYRDTGIPVAWVTRAGLARLFPRLNLEKLARSIDLNEAPRSMAASDDTASFAVAVQRNSVPVANVGGLVPGDDRLLVIGAHYDHLGYGQAGTRVPGVREIHNGADDNASGTAVLLEVGRALAAAPPGPTVALVAFTGEEAGLVGSAHYVNNSSLPIERTGLMMNFDMVGRMQNSTLTVYGVESGAELKDLVATAGADLPLTLAPTGGGYGASDQTSFYVKGVPVLHLLTSLHADYHRPDDDAEFLNLPGMKLVTDFALAVVDSWAALDEPITYVDASDPAAKSSRHSSRRVSMGTIPDFTQPDSLRGFRIQGVVPGKPAALARLDSKDIIIAIGDILIDNIYDLTYALGKFEPGEEVEVRYLRGDQEFTTRLTFVESTPRGGGHGGSGGPPPGVTGGGHPGGKPHADDHGAHPHGTPPDSSSSHGEHPQATEEHPQTGKP